MENISSESIAARLYAIEERINNAAERALRNPDDISLVAVSKTFPPEIIDEGIRAGISILGESKIQEAMAKHEQCSSADWHFITAPTRNKIRHALSYFAILRRLSSLWKAYTSQMKQGNDQLFLQVTFRRSIQDRVQSGGSQRNLNKFSPINQRTEHSWTHDYSPVGTGSRSVSPLLPHTAGIKRFHLLRTRN